MSGLASGQAAGASGEGRALPAGEVETAAVGEGVSDLLDEAPGLAAVRESVLMGVLDVAVVGDDMPGTIDASEGDVELVVFAIHVGYLSEVSC